MILKIHLTPEIEARLLEQAVLAGKQPEELAIEVLQQTFAMESVAAQTVPDEEWQRLFDAWVANHHSRNPSLDDSRERIYADRDWC